MWLEADLRVKALFEPDDFTALKVVAQRPDHVWLTRAEIERLAGDRASDPAWLEQLEQMLGYAASKGWVDAEGAVRAHIEWT